MPAENRPDGKNHRSSSSPDNQGDQPKNIQVVEFLLGKEHYAIDLYDVREVVDYTTITRLPNTPAYIKGIIDLRGEITTIIDLKNRLNVTADKNSLGDDKRRIIVLDEKLTRAKMGIIVDDVLSVSTFDCADVDRSSASLYNEDTSIRGIIRKKVRVRDNEVSDLIVWIGIRQILMDEDYAKS
ncbi:MAG: chemotaxis protein CheW [Methanoregula sp.]|nr:chemotaxis protein CheW [Methanoregula sp.]